MILYTDISPECCAWLGSRVEDGSLPPGDVLLADVRDLCAEHVRDYRQVHLFCGIGGFPLALSWAEWPDDLAVLTGGFPCQDISVAGKGAGLSGAKSGLFWEMKRVSQLCVVDVLIAENVGALNRRGLDVVADALDEAGYIVPEAYRVGAWAVGAPHKRERWWIPGWRKRATISDALSGGPQAERKQETRTVAHEPSAAGWGRAVSGPWRRESGEWRYAGPPVFVYRNGQRCKELHAAALPVRPGFAPRRPDPTVQRGWPVPVLPGYEQHAWELPRLHQRGMGDAVHGIPGRMADALNRCGVMALGNAIVPQVAAAIARGVIAARGRSALSVGTGSFLGPPPLETQSESNLRCRSVSKRE